MKYNRFTLPDCQLAAALVSAANIPEDSKIYRRYRDILSNMTYHERRLHVRQIMKDVKVYHAVKAACIT